MFAADLRATIRQNALYHFTAKQDSPTRAAYHNPLSPIHRLFQSALHASLAQSIFRRRAGKSTLVLTGTLVLISCLQRPSHRGGCEHGIAAHSPGTARVYCRGLREGQSSRWSFREKSPSEMAEARDFNHDGKMLCAPRKKKSWMLCAEGEI